MDGTTAIKIDYYEELKAKADKYDAVTLLMAQHFLGSQDAQCLLCDNHMKNMTINRVGNQGCDGNCRHNKVYTAKDLVEMFEKEIEINGKSHVLDFDEGGFK